MINLLQQISESSIALLIHVAENGENKASSEYMHELIRKAGRVANDDIIRLADIVFSSPGAGLSVIESKIDDPSISGLLNQHSGGGKNQRAVSIIDDSEVPRFTYDLECMLDKMDATKTLSECIEDITSGEFVRAQAAASKLTDVQRRILNVGVDTSDTIVLGDKLTQAELEQSMRQSDRDTIRGTGTIFDYWMRVGPGELGVILAPPGVGKTTALIDIGVGYAEQDDSDGVVIHFSEELSKAVVTKKYISRLCSNNDEENVLKIMQRLTSLGSPVVIESHPTGTSTVPYLHNRVERILKEYKLDRRLAAIIVDYAALIRDSEEKSRYEMLSQVIIKLRQMACDFQCPVWTASQPQRNPARETRTSIKIDNVSANPVLGMADVAECWAIPQVADYLLSLNQTDDERAADPAQIRIFPAKIRTPNSNIVGKHTKAVKFTIDYAHCKIL